MKFPVYVKPPQSGKTRDAIIEPMKKSLARGRIPVVVLPSRIQLQKQTTRRLIDEQMGLTEQNIGRFDTGVRNRNSSSECVEGISKGSLRALVVLNNSSGITKLIYTMVKSEKKFDIIVDEIHGFFNMDFREPNEEPFWEKLREGKTIKLDPSTRMSILFGLIRSKEFTFSGTTATVSYIAQSKLMKELDLVPLVVKLKTPECYLGYDQIPKKIYSGDFRDCLRSIIRNNPLGTVTMCHVDRKQETHYQVAELWIDSCLADGVSRDNILALVDNGDGYTLFNWAKIVKNYDKSKTSEPWKIIDTYKNKFNYTHIGIFGDRCMSESNTYQKCVGDTNCPINDLVVVPFNHSLDNMTIMIQKIGRIFGNDTIGGNRRTIWFPRGYKSRVELGLHFDELIQNECNLARVNLRAIRKRVEPKSDGTKIGRFRDSLDSSRLYTRKEIITLLGEYKYPDAMLRSLCRENNYSVHLLEQIGDNYRLKS